MTEDVSSVCMVTISEMHAYKLVMTVVIMNFYCNFI
jgi:hypothetical protein